MAEPLAHAVHNCLKKQDVDISVAILTSFLLDTYPNNEKERHVEEKLVLRKKLADNGDVGDVTVYVEKCDFSDIDSTSEYLLVRKENEECACLLVTEAKHGSFDCFQNIQLGTKVIVTQHDASLYRVRAFWSMIWREDRDEDSDSIVIINESSDNEEDSLMEDSFIVMKGGTAEAIKKIESQKIDSVQLLSTDITTSVEPGDSTNEEKPETPVFSSKTDSQKGNNYLMDFIVMPVFFLRPVGGQRSRECGGECDDGGGL